MLKCLYHFVSYLQTNQMNVFSSNLDLKKVEYEKKTTKQHLYGSIRHFPQKHGHKKSSFMKICLMSFVYSLNGPHPSIDGRPRHWMELLELSRRS